MARNDWAIVIGIKDYIDPDLGGLEGPENDARAFHEWVLKEDGGDVPKGQAALIVSSDFGPPFANAAAAMPTQEAIKAAFDHLFSIADGNEAKELSREIGDRLYLFFSGHGFAPDQHDELVALLTANASVAGAQLSHVIGSYMADTFWRAGLFKEVLLFMDCCRSVMDCAQLYQPYADERATDFDQVRRFYAYGARVAKEAREWKMDDGKYHGVFTATLLDALTSSGYDREDPSVITADSLNNQLYNGFKSFLSPADRTRPGKPWEPTVVYERNPASTFTILRRKRGISRFFSPAPVKLCKVTILPSPARIGKKVTIIDQKMAKVSDTVLEASTTVSLQLGFYGLLVEGEQLPVTFEVVGDGKEVRA